MASSKTFNNVTASVWECVKTSSYKEHGTIYAPPGAASGTATTKTIVGTVELSFNFDSTQSTVAYTILKKPGIVSEKQVWGGIQDSINACSGK